MKSSFIIYVFLIFILSCQNDDDHPINMNQLTTAAPLQWSQVVVGDQWTIVDIVDDPFRSFVDAHTACKPIDFGEEYGGVEVSTQQCGYITLSQPTLIDIKIDDLFELNIWHSPLLNDEVTEGMIILQVAQTILWSHTLSIPGPARSWTVRFPAPLNIPKDTPLLFHIRNHGANSYTLNDLSVAR